MQGQLRKYLDENLPQKGRRRLFAEQCGITEAMLSYILSGKRRPSAEAARAIEQATGGAVKARDLRPDLAEIFGDPS